MNCASRWKPGDRIVMRSVWDGRIQAAWPVTVVSDTKDALVLFLAAGTMYKIRQFSYDLKDRMPIGEWELIDREWTRDMIRIMLPGDSHAYLGFWDQSCRFDRWYINLEREYERTSSGIEFVDLFLDLVIDADTKEWSWKDESELSCAVSLGLVSEEEADHIRNEGCTALRHLDAGEPPFGQGWEQWTVDPEWSMPSLSPGWDR